METPTPPEGPRIDEAEIEDLEQIVAMLADDVLGATREIPPPPLDPCYVRAFEAITPIRCTASWSCARATG